MVVNYKNILIRQHKKKVGNFVLRSKFDEEKVQQISLQYNMKLFIEWNRNQ